MSFAEHIRACNNADPRQLVPLLARDDRRIGWLPPDNAAALSRFRRVFAAEPECVRLVAEGDVGPVSAAVDEVVEALVVEKQVPKWRNETFDVMARWGEAPLFRLDRGAVPFFGVRAYGVHLNGYRFIDGRPHLWIGRRAPDKRVAPDKLDNIVAGGIGNGHGVVATLFKESDEEGGIPASLVAQARAAGAVSYLMRTDLGIRDDVLFVYDLELPADFTPKNSDGEIVRFELMPADEVIERVRKTGDFKFNVNLVILDFAMRHGLLRSMTRNTLTSRPACTARSIDPILGSLACHTDSPRMDVPLLRGFRRGGTVSSEGADQRVGFGVGQIEAADEARHRTAAAIELKSGLFQLVHYGAGQFEKDFVGLDRRDQTKARQPGDPGGDARRGGV